MCTGSYNEFMRTFTQMNIDSSVEKIVMNINTSLHLKPNNKLSFCGDDMTGGSE